MPSTGTQTPSIPFDVGREAPPIFIGKTFGNKLALKNALKTDAAFRGYSFHVRTTNKTRFSATCARKQGDRAESAACPFRIHAVGFHNGLFEVRGWTPHHSCGAGVDPKRTVHGAEWVSSKVGCKIERMHEYEPKQIMADIERDFGVSIKYSTAWRAREICRKRINGPAPLTKRAPGRPKKVRVEAADPAGRRLKCSRCRAFGHNKRSCKVPVIQPPPVLPSLSAVSND